MNQGDRTLWMGDLEPYMDATFIGQAFEKMGEEVKAVKVVYDKYNGRAAGYCFVDLEDGESARRAMLNISGKVIPKSKPPVTFNLSFANSPTAPYTEYNLFVNNLSMDLDDAGLFLVFGEKYRSCRGAKVYKDREGNSRGLGFVRFADQTDQQQALVEMHKFKVKGKEMLLKLAQPKYRSPRGGSSGAAPSYEPQTYYPRYQEFYNSQHWHMYDYNAAPPLPPPPQHIQLQVMPQVFPAMQMAPPMMLAPQPVAMMPQQLPPQIPQHVQSDSVISLTEPVNTPINQSSGDQSFQSEQSIDQGDPDLKLESYHDTYRNVDEANKEFMCRSEELYVSLENSRWCPKVITTSLNQRDL